MSDRSHPTHSNLADDERWVHGMNGWRVRITSMVPELRGRYGEVTGFEHGVSPRFYVVLDGEEEPHKFWWTEVRPI